MASNNSLVIPQNDLSFMLQQTENETNTMIAGMLSIINKNEMLNEGLQSQPWCKRMFNTIIGKNKATATEIRQNHDKLNAYVVQAVGELYNRNKINSQIMVSLGLQITELYNSHLELKSMLHSLVDKLNEKIESIDNYHILLQEIDEGVYGNTSNIAGLLSVISQIDHRMISDSKKLRLLERKMSNMNLLSADTLSIRDFLIGITDLNDDSLGIVYTDLQLYQNDYVIIALAINTVESWNLLPASNRKFLKKQTIIDRIILESGVDESVNISFYEFYDEVIALRQSLINNTKALPMDEETVHYDDNGYEDDEYESEEVITSLSELMSLYGGSDIDDDEDDISEKILSCVEYYLGSESNCVTHTGYISYDLREKAKKNIVDKSDVMSGIAGAVIGGVIGGVFGGPVGAALIGKGLGDMGKHKQEFTCDADDIIAIVDGSAFNNCKDGLVFTKDGVFFSQTGDVSIYIEYSDISEANGTTGFLGGKLEIERYWGSDFTWTDTLIPKNKIASLLNELKNI